MPHKHKRKRDAAEDSDAIFNLPPTTTARPLPTKVSKPEFHGFDSNTKKDGKRTGKESKASEPARKKRKSNKAQAVEDDTPKNFARLMNWHVKGQKLRGGLDNGSESITSAKKNSTKPATKSKPETQAADKKLKPGQPSTINGVDSKGHKTNGNKTDASTDHTDKTTTEDDTTNNPTQPQPSTQIKILPNESLSSFAARVDQSLPFNISASKSQTSKPTLPTDLIPKTKLTKHNRRLQNVQNEWRLIKAKERERKEKAEDEDFDGREERREEEKLLWIPVQEEYARKKGKKKVAAAKGVGDPWKMLDRKRRVFKQKGLRDVVEAPPSLGKIKKIFREG